MVRRRGTGADVVAGKRGLESVSAQGSQYSKGGMGKSWRAMRKEREEVTFLWTSQVSYVLKT